MSNAPPTADYRALVVSGALPPADDPEVAWRIAALRTTMPATGTIRPSHLVVRPFTPRPAPAEKIETDPPVPPKPRSMDKEEYAALRAKITREWREAKQKDQARREREEIWQCISCGLDLPFGHLRCKYCLAAYHAVSLARFNPGHPAVDPSHAPVTPTPSVAILEIDPEEEAP